MDFKRVRTFVTVAEHGTRPRILYGQASQTGRPKCRSRSHLPSSGHGCFRYTYSPASQALHAESHCIAAMQAIALVNAERGTLHALCLFLGRPITWLYFPKRAPSRMLKNLAAVGPGSPEGPLSFSAAPRAGSAPQANRKARLIEKRDTEQQAGRGRPGRSFPYRASRRGHSARTALIPAVRGSD